MDGNVMYHKMVEEVQILELMLDSEHGNLSRAAPKRTISAPANHFLIDHDFEDETILKSCPANVEKPILIGDASDASMECVEVIKQEDLITDSPAIPDFRPSPKLPIVCKPPPDIKPSPVVNEIPRGIGTEGKNDDQSGPQVTKSDERQRPIIPPRKSMKQNCKDVEKPVPVPRRKKLPNPQTAPDQPLPPTLAWEPDPEARAENNKTFHEPMTDKYIGSQESSNEARQAYAYENTAVSELDVQIQELKRLCLTGAQQDKKDSVLKNIITMSNSINNKYAIIDVSGLIENNKGNSRGIITVALTVLETYAMNLLKQEKDRPANWRKIDFSNEKFQHKVGFLKGFEEILTKLGYEEKIYSENGTVVGQRFRDSVRNSNRIMVEKVLTDLCIANYEIDTIVTRKHPNWKKLLETKQIPPEYNTIDGSDSDSDNVEDEEEDFVLASSPISFYNQASSKRISIYEDEDDKERDAIRRSMENRAYTELRGQNAGFIPSDQEMLYNQPAQGVPHEEQMFSSVLRPPSTQSYHKTWHAPASNQPMKYWDEAQNFNESDKFGQSSQDPDFNRPERLSQFHRLNESPNFKRPNELSPFNQPSQGQHFNGADESLTFRQPKQKFQYTSSYQPASYWQPERIPENSGINQVLPFAIQDEQYSQPAHSNMNFYASDTTWVYSTSVTTPAKSETYQQSKQNAGTVSAELDYSRRRLPEIYSREEEVPTLGANSRIHDTNAEEFPLGKPRIYSEVQSPHLNMAGSSPFREQYDIAYSSYAPSQFQQPSYSSQSLRDYNYEDKNAPRAQHSHQSLGTGHQRPNRYHQGYSGGIGYAGPIPFEKPKLYESSSFDEMTNFPHEFQKINPSQMKEFSPPQGSFIPQNKTVYGSKEEKSEDGKTFWSCKHCTYHNPVGTRVCQMCYKTSWESNGSSEPELEILQASYVPGLPPHPSDRPPFAPLVDEIDQSHTHEKTPQGGSGGSLYANVGHVNAPYSRNDYGLSSTYRNGPQSDPYGFETSMVTQYYDQSLAGYMKAPPASSGARNHSYTYRRNTLERRSMSDHELKKQREVALRIEKDEINQEELKKDAEELMDVIKLSEDRGFDVSEVEAASVNVSNTSDILAWLEVKWPLSQSELIQSYVTKFNEIISRTEAREVLVKYPLNFVKALEQCKVTREEKIKTLQDQLMDSHLIKLKVIKEKLTQCEGDVSKAQLELELKLLEDVRENIFDCNEEEATQNLYNTLMDKEKPMDSRTSIVLAQYGMKSWGRAEIVVKLIDKFPEERKAEKSFFSDCVLAAQQNEDFKRAIRFMAHECPICVKEVAVCNMSSFLHCESIECQICDECFGQHVKSKIENIRKLVCPVCGKPERLDEENTLHHFQHLSHKIEGLVENEWLPLNIRNMFEEKLRDFSLKDDPNFRWCAHCPEYGFLWEEPENIQMHCTKCRKHTCFLCKEKWEDQHEGITCEEFRAWKLANDPENQMQGLQTHLAENGITCPKCNHRYDLARGGCIHFTCRMCDFQFCGDCYGEFISGDKCPDHPEKGLHCHHPRNCIYYLRDECVKTLQELLKFGDVEFEIEKPADQIEDVCRLVEQKEEDGTGRKYDEPCGNQALNGFAGLCEKHYKEYLIGLINDNELDPLDVMSMDEIARVMDRHRVPLPAKKRKDAKNNIYLNKVKQAAKEKIPLIAIGKKATEKAKQRQQEQQQLPQQQLPQPQLPQPQLPQPQLPQPQLPQPQLPQPQLPQQQLPQPQQQQQP